MVHRLSHKEKGVRNLSAYISYKSIYMIWNLEHDGYYNKHLSSIAGIHCEMLNLGFASKKTLDMQEGNLEKQIPENSRLDLQGLLLDNAGIINLSGEHELSSKFEKFTEDL